MSRFSVHRHVVGWNNGGGGGNFSKVNLIVAKWTGTWKRLFSSFLPHGWEFRKAGPGNFPKTCFTPSHKPTNAHLPLFIGSWNMQEHLDSDQFWFGDGRICRVFPPLCVLYKSTQTCHLFYCTRPKNCIFGGTCFEPIKNLTILCAVKLQVANPSYSRRPSSLRKREGNVRFPTNLHVARRSARPTSR